MKMKHSPRSERGKRRPGQGDAEYNRLMGARREYDESLAPDPAPKSKPRKSGPVTVRQGSRTWVQPSYDEYITSRGWEVRRADYFSSHPRKCQACGSLDQIHLHHKTYARMGRELDSDLVALCQQCHSEVHESHRKQGGNLAAVTDQFVKKGWLAQKKSKTLSQKGSRANKSEKRNARQAKSKKVLPHSQNPVEHSSGDVALTNQKVSKVKVISSSGSVRIESDSAIRSQTAQAQPKPQWVKRAESRKR